MRLSQSTTTQRQHSDFLLLADANVFIAFIHETRTSYRDGTLDLVTAAITTNTTIDVRQMTEEVKPMLDQHPLLQRALDVLYLARYREIGMDPSYREQQHDPFNLEAYDATQDLFVTTSKAFETMPNIHNIGCVSKSYLEPLLGIRPTE